VLSNSLHCVFNRQRISPEVKANMVNARAFHCLKLFDKPVYASFNPESVAFYRRFVVFNQIKVNKANVRFISRNFPP
tara:strand:- start:62 stop:292 length:231 start_codon:yes stop_codon:yes gene_type:complete